MTRASTSLAILFSFLASLWWLLYGEWWEVVIPLVMIVVTARVCAYNPARGRVGR